MRSDRLLSIVLLLQGHGRLTGRDLSERLEVSERTLHRDMEALSAAGVPVFALRGSRGGWQLMDNWRMEVPGLDEAELRAFLMAQPRISGDPRLAGAAQSALAKLMASLPEPLRERAASIRQRLHVDTTGWRGTSEPLPMLPIVQDAVSRDRKLAIRYWSANSDRTTSPRRNLVDRIIDPLGLVAKGSTWYLVANTPRGFRTYRVSRIEHATLLDKPCQRPPGFDLASHWKSSTEQFTEGWKRIDVTLRLEPTAAEEMKMWRLNTTIDEAATRNDPQGWFTMRVRFDAEGEADFIILGLGARVEVLDPASVRDRIAAEITSMYSRLQSSNRAALSP